MGRKFSDIEELDRKSRSKSSAIHQKNRLEEKEIKLSSNELELICEENYQRDKFSDQIQNAPVATSGIKWSEVESDVESNNPKDQKVDHNFKIIVKK